LEYVVHNVVGFGSCVQLLIGLVVCGAIVCLVTIEVVVFVVVFAILGEVLLWLWTAATIEQLFCAVLTRDVLFHYVTPVGNARFVVAAGGHLDGTVGFKATHDLRTVIVRGSLNAGNRISRTTTARLPVYEGDVIVQSLRGQVDGFDTLREFRTLTHASNRYGTSPSEQARTEGGKRHHDKERA